MSTHDLGAFEFKFLAELKRRNVFRVAAAYLGAAWFIVHVCTVLGETYAPVHRAVPTIIAILGVAFPLALIGAWVFELTPQGFKLTRRVERSRSIRAITARKLDVATMTVLALAVVAMLIDSRVLHRPADESVVPVFALVILAMLADRLIGLRTAKQTSQPVASKTETTPAPQSPPSMAVLPFANLTGEPEKEYFGDGMAEELINVLSRVPGLKVPARTSSFSYKGKHVDVRQIARDLGVETVLEGSVRSAGERIRVVAQLVNASTGFHVWSHSWDRQFEDLFNVQDELAGAIVRALGFSANDSAIGNLVQAPPTSDLEAYQLYLQGLSLRSRPNMQNLLRAIELFKQAKARDPHFTRADTAAIAARDMLTAWGFTAGQTLSATEHEARQALALDPSIADAHLVLGVASGCRGKFLEAEKHSRAALSSQSSDPEVLAAYGTQVLWPVGHIRRSLHELEEAYRHKPTYAPVVAMFSFTHMILANDTEALRLARLAADLGARIALHPVRSFAALRDGRYEEAADELFAAMPSPVQTQLDPAVLTLAYSAVGDASHKPAALASLSRLDITTGHARLDSLLQIHLLLLYTLLGELDPAFEQANRFLDRFAESNEIGQSGQWGNLWHPEMRPFRQDPRFAALATRLGLMDYWKQYGPPDNCELRDGKLICT
jgi:TolB-like protein/acyl-CoA-binding protein